MDLGPCSPSVMASSDSMEPPYDDRFRMTKDTPPIYYLPHSNEQVAALQVYKVEHPDKISSRLLDRAEKEDRISNLHDDLLCHILSFIPIKSAVQTCLLSRRWTHVWATLPHLNFYALNFSAIDEFHKFVKKFLSKRNHGTKVSTIHLNFGGYISGGSGCDKTIIRVSEYGIAHSIQELIIVDAIGFKKFLPCIFSSPYLKKLTLNFDKLTLKFDSWQCYDSPQSMWSLPSLTFLELHSCTSPELPWSFPSLKTLHLWNCNVPLMTWTLPKLTTLHLHRVKISGGKGLAFEEFSQLENLTLFGSETWSHMEVFSITSLSLTELTINTTVSYPICKFMVLAPSLRCINYMGEDLLLSCADDVLPNLESVNLDIAIFDFECEGLLEQLISLFEEVRTAKFLTLCWSAIEVLLRASEFLEYHPSPFGNLKCLKVKAMWGSDNLTIPGHVESYFLGSSPSATIVIVIEDDDGITREYNPKVNMSCSTSGMESSDSVESSDSAQPSPPCVQVKEETGALSLPL